MGELKDGQVVRVTDYWREPIRSVRLPARTQRFKEPDAEELTEH
jgi:hypothetical protein